MSTKVPSMAFQVKQLFDNAQRIGQSRHKAKAALYAREKGRRRRKGRMLKTIHSWGTYRRQLHAAVQFAKWCKAKYGIKYLAEITPEMTRAYFAWRRNRVAGNTLAADLTAIRRLDLWLNADGKGERIVPPDIRAPRETRPRGAYPVSEVQAVIDYVSERDPLSGLILRVQLAAGLRIHEAVWIRSDCIDRDAGTVVVGVTGKGGKPRSVELPADLLACLDLSVKFPLRPTRHSRKDTSQIRRIDTYVEMACVALDVKWHGTHGFRATAAITHYQDLVGRGISKREALAQTAAWLGHGPDRLDVLRIYLGDDIVDDALDLDIYAQWRREDRWREEIQMYVRPHELDSFMSEYGLDNLTDATTRQLADWLLGDTKGITFSDEEDND